MVESSEVFQTESDGSTLIVIPAGEQIGFRLSQVQHETDEIVRRLSDESLCNVVIDAGETDYLSSTTIGALIQIWETVREAGGHFVLCNLSDDAMSTIVAMRLDTRWPSYTSREEALEAIR